MNETSAEPTNVGTLAGEREPATEREEGERRPHDDRSAARDFAWKVHDVHIDWIAKVDTKAWIGFSLQAALIAMVVNLSVEPERPFGSLHGWQLIVFRIANGALGLGVVSAALVVVPHLARRRHGKERSPDQTAPGDPMRSASPSEAPDLVYFGDLRGWGAIELRDRLSALTDAAIVQMLAKQITALAGICWWKHVALQVSMTFWAAGALMLVAAAL